MPIFKGRSMWFLLCFLFIAKLLTLKVICDLDLHISC